MHTIEDKRLMAKRLLMYLDIEAPTDSQVNKLMAIRYTSLVKPLILKSKEDGLTNGQNATRHRVTIKHIEYVFSNLSKSP